MSENLAYLIHPLKVGNYEIKGNLFLAPMAGYTDKAFRAQAIEQQADFTFTEMLSAEAIIRNNLKTFKIAEPAYNENIFAIQIFCSNYKVAVACAKKLLVYNPFLLDLNCGCSVPKILKTGSGAALMLEPKKIGEIVKALKENLSILVSIKMRSGWDAMNINFLSVAEEALKAGVDMLSLHPRTRSQFFKGQANWQHIRKLKNFSPVPVIGSGDLVSSEIGLKMLKETGCDGIMFARGAIGNPFIFKQTKLLAANNTYFNPSKAERLYVAYKQLLLLCSYKAELIACREMRKFIACYLKGLERACEMRRAFNEASTLAEYKKIILKEAPELASLLP